MKKRTKLQSNEQPLRIGDEKPKGMSGKLISNITETMNTILSRAGLAYRLGKSFGGDRELYKVLGYPLTLTYNDFYARYVRQDIAKAVINAFPDATWRAKPEVTDDQENEDDETDFETKWKEIAKDRKVFHYLRRADRMAGIGYYSVVLLGFDDVAIVEDLKKEVSGAKALKYLKPYSQASAAIKDWDNDANSERFGLPKTYTVEMGIGDKQSFSREVHWSRILHIADDTLGSDTLGTPRTEAIYNRLQDLEMIVGGSAEMFWRSAYPGMALEMDKDANPSTQDLTAVEDEVEKYIHGLNRYMRLQGIEAKQLAPKVASPKQHVEVELMMISAATRIPVRILIGSEEAKYAGEQDDEHWNDRVDERRQDFADPMILRVLIDRLIKYKVLPEPKEKSYDIIWPDIDALSEKDQVDINEKRVKTMAEYVKHGLSEIMPPMIFLTEFMLMDKEKAQAIMNEVEKTLEGMQKAEEKEMRAAELEEARIRKEQQEEEE